MLALLGKRKTDFCIKLNVLLIKHPGCYCVAVCCRQYKTA